MTRPSATRVAYLYEKEQLTRQTQMLADAIDAFVDPLRKVARALGGWERKPLPPEAVGEIREAARALYDMLDLQFEDPLMEKRLGKFIRRGKNFRKLVGAYRNVRDAEELAEVYRSQGTKSKDAWQKLYEYREEFLSLIRTFDTETEASFQQGAFQVVLIRAGGLGWREETVQKLKAVLTETQRYLDARGLGALTKGLTVFAYPTSTIPGTGNASAWYDRSKDVAAIAAGSSWFHKTPVGRMVQTMVHELGHRAYYHLMEGRGRQSWDEFFEEMQEPPPDLDRLIQRWEAWANEWDDERQRRRRSHFHEFYHEFKKTDPQAAEWLRMAVESMGLDREEKFDRYHGLPTKTSVPALEKLREKKDEVRVFAEPVTAYSATNPKELFAEAFTHYLTYGPRALQPRLRDQFRRTLPMMKVGADDDGDDADGWPG